MSAIYRLALLLCAALCWLPAWDGAGGLAVAPDARLRVDTRVAASPPAGERYASLARDPPYWLPTWLRCSSAVRSRGPCAAETTVRGRALAELRATEGALVKA